MKQIQGKQGLVRGIGRFGKLRVREIGIPLYSETKCMYSTNYTESNFGIGVASSLLGI